LLARAPGVEIEVKSLLFHAGIERKLRASVRLGGVF
jgi:hypothetical protein